MILLKTESRQARKTDFSVAYLYFTSDKENFAFVGCFVSMFHSSNSPKMKSRLWFCYSIL